MRKNSRAVRTRLRSLFVSDIHLGCKYSQAESFLQFLESRRPDHLYLVGDFIDGWRLKKHWRWHSVYARVFKRLLSLADGGTQLYYTPGNHDSFLRDYLHDFGFVQIADQFIHTTADQRRFVVLHGDQFDDVERRFGWLSHVGSGLYDFVLWFNAQVNRLRRHLRLEDARFSTRLKLCVKQAVTFVSHFEERVVRHARDNFCDGIICGHIHCPRISQVEDILYCNTGDWVEHCTALVEHFDGRMELYNDPSQRGAATLDTPRQDVFALHNGSHPTIVAKLLIHP